MPAPAPVMLAAIWLSESPGLMVMAMGLWLASAAKLLPEIVPNWMLSVPEPVVALEEEKAGEASTCAEARWLTSSE